VSPKTLSVHFLLSLACSVSFAANDSLVRQSLSEVTQAKDQANIAFREASTNDQKERLRYISQRLTSAENLLQSSLGGGNFPPPPPPQPPSSGVEIYHTASCTGSLIGTANPGTRCEKFATAPAAWAVKINGQCLNIPDIPAPEACESFKGAAEQNAALIYTTDSCTSSPIAAVGSLSDCSKLPIDGTKAWAVKVDNKCFNIADTSPSKACEAFKASSSPSSVRIFATDSCTDSPMAIVDYNTRCDLLTGMHAAWGIMMNGRCENIPDLPIEAACERYRP
jgi:hypothetical protein